MIEQPLISESDGDPLSGQPPFPYRKIDIGTPLLADVVSVFGSTENDLIIGNGKDNSLSGEGGFNILEGKEGQDVYVIKGNDGDIIQNYAVDNSTDMIMEQET